MYSSHYYSQVEPSLFSLPFHQIVTSYCAASLDSSNFLCLSCVPMILPSFPYFIPTENKHEIVELNSQDGELKI
jgi:hypothetical protein